MFKALFLDRDGTLIEDRGYVCRKGDLRILPGVIEGLNLLKKDYLFFIITNQSGIGRGFYSLKDFHVFHDFSIAELLKHNIEIKKTYFCPHLKEDNCRCRKPNPSNIEEAVRDFNINLAESWVIGDHVSDIQTGINAGCRTAFLLTGHGREELQELNKKNIKPAIIAEYFLEAAKKIAEIF